MDFPGRRHAVDPQKGRILAQDFRGDLTPKSASALRRLTALIADILKPYAVKLPLSSP
jgi:hypothetical protein